MCLSTRQFQDGQYLSTSEPNWNPRGVLMNEPGNFLSGAPCPSGLPRAIPTGNPGVCIIGKPTKSPSQRAIINTHSASIENKNKISSPKDKVISKLQYKKYPNRFTKYIYIWYTYQYTNQTTKWIPNRCVKNQNNWKDNEVDKNLDKWSYQISSKIRPKWSQAREPISNIRYHLK